MWMKLLAVKFIKTEALSAKFEILILLKIKAKPRYQAIEIYII